MTNLRYIAAIEIGSSKIRGAVASVDERAGRLAVIAVAEERVVDLVRYGIVAKPAEVMSHIVSICEKLESNPEVYPRKINSVAVALGGHSLLCTCRSAEAEYAKDEMIDGDIIKALKTEVFDSWTEDRYVLKVLPRDFFVDGENVPDPKGMYARSIRAEMNVVYCKAQLKRSIERVFAGVVKEERQLSLDPEESRRDERRFNVVNYPVRQLVSADLVLTRSEKNLGCMFVDFGAETTAVSIYKADTLRHLVTIPIGSRNITRDIMSYRTCLESEAEEIKCEIGDVDPHEKKGATLEQKKLDKVIFARAAEIVANILAQMKYAGYKAADLPGGIVITGGGANLKGFTTLLRRQSEMKVRIATSALPMVQIRDKNFDAASIVDVVAILLNTARLRNVGDMLSVPNQPVEGPDPIVGPKTDDKKEDVKDEKEEAKETKEATPAIDDEQDGKASEKKSGILGTIADSWEKFKELFKDGNVENDSEKENDNL